MTGYGGIVGGTENTIIIGCENKGIVTGKGFDVGGICGSTQVNSLIKDCSNEGAVSRECLNWSELQEYLFRVVEW